MGRDTKLAWLAGFGPHYALMPAFPLLKRAVEVRHDFGGAAAVAGNDDKNGSIHAQFVVGELVFCGFGNARHRENLAERKRQQNLLAFMAAVQAPSDAMAAPIGVIEKVLAVALAV